MQSISLCMITKNEEKNIKRCLDSVKDIVDEIIIVDTGSTDNTINIAKSYTDKIYSHTWNFDFSEARNKSLEKATKDWILVLDADEYITKSESIKLKKLITSSNYEAIFFKLQNIVDNKIIGDAVVLRAFKNNPLYKFKNKIHEQIIFSIEENNKQNMIFPSDIKILHFGYDPSLCDLTQKTKRNIDILENYNDQDKDGYFYYSLGNEYSRIKDIPKSLQMYQTSLELTTKSNDNLPSHLPHLIINLAKTLAHLKKYNEAIDIIDYFDNKYPNFRDLYFLKSLYLTYCGKFTYAKENLLKYLNCENYNYIFPNNNFEDFYDMGKILKEIRHKSINKNKDFIDTIFISNSYNDTLLTSIKNINEISSSIYICLLSSSIVDKNLLQNHNANLVIGDTNKNQELFFDSLKQCSSEFVLLMKSREIIDFETQVSLIKFLENTNENFFNLTISNKMDNSQKYEFRLFRNTDEIKNISSFNDFLNLTTNQEIKTYNITITSV